MAATLRNFLVATLHGGGCVSALGDEMVHCNHRLDQVVSSRVFLDKTPPTGLGNFIIILMQSHMAWATLSSMSNSGSNV